ncbi:MAG: cytochrome c, class [Gammaproteobacteria bacterium]|nr:cytochrome c, class [Gammaproteobacteria bacterium]
MPLCWLVAGIASIVSVLAASHWARADNLPQQLGLHSGRDIYQAACAACHGANGEGTPETTTGFVPPDTFPHFNRCDETTPEYTRDWTAVVRDGGPARGFSQIMPAFSGVLTRDQINQVVTYLRGLCAEKDWPRGELNVPRALLTEKAFPESETVLTTTVNTKGPATVSNELVYEKILGKRDQLEVAVPFGWSHQNSGALSGGLGDIAVGIKHVLFSRLHTDDGKPIYDSTGSILSFQGEVVLPTGSVDKGLGTGETSFGVFGAYDQLFPAQTFMQIQAGANLPLHTQNVPRSAFFRSAFGKSFSGSQELGRLWSPMVEVVADRELRSGATTDWDVIPELQVTVNRRQHIRAALGYRIPINDTTGRPRQVMAYFLWDWFDGGLLEGW